MKYGIVSAPAGRSGDAVRNTEENDGWWVRFGSDLFIYSANNRWSDIRESHGGNTRGEGTVRKGNMHLVVQKGRTFQQAHPDVPILLDKGRYLVVDLPAASAKKMAVADEVCFAIEPLRENSIAFDACKPKITERASDGVSDLVSGLTEASFASRLGHLVGFRTRHSASPEFRLAADWCETELAAMGYSVRQESVSLPGGGESRNVIATRTGTGTSRSNFVVVAHLDSVNHPGGAGADAPGADDNASGSAGLLTLAEALAPHRYTHDLTFLLVGGEEQGLHGSTQYLATLNATERERIAGVLNMDMIGSVNISPQTVLLEGAEISQPQIDALASAAAEFTSLSLQISLNPFASDHVPFIDAGVPAVLTIEGADGANDAIHTAGDTLDRVDPAFAVEILRMNLGYLATAAGYQEPKSDCGCGCGSTSAADDQTRALALHYQTLLAQYSRLGRDGLLSQTDMETWRHLYQAHHSLTAKEDA